MNINIYNLIQGFEQDDDGAVRQIGADSWLGGRKATPKVHHSTNTKHKIQYTNTNTVQHRDEKSHRCGRYICAIFSKVVLILWIVIVVHLIAIKQQYVWCHYWERAKFYYFLCCHQQIRWYNFRRQIPATGWFI